MAVKNLSKSALCVQAFPSKLFIILYMWCGLVQVCLGCRCQHVDMLLRGAAGMVFVKRAHAGHGRFQLSPRDPPQDKPEPIIQDGDVFKMESIFKEITRNREGDRGAWGGKEREAAEGTPGDRKRCTTVEEIIPKVHGAPKTQQIFLKDPCWKRGKVCRKKWQRKTIRD